jgi:hypothetical protein
MATNTETQPKDELKDTLAFLRLYRYISFYCTVCEGEYSLEEAGQMVGHEDYSILSESEDKDSPSIHNVVCPECGHPYPEVILGV